MKLSWVRIPQAMRSLPQWAVATMAPLPNGKPDKSPRHPISGARLDVTKPQEWATFDQAASAGYPAIGFLLTDDDPFVVIDLDDPNELDNPLDAARQAKIYEAFPSYSEASISGKGVHIILKGAPGPGVRRDGVEVYSQERFIICTGDVMRDLPIAENPLLPSLINEMMKHGGRYGGELPASQAEVTSDAEILDRLNNARNAAKFRALYYDAARPGDDKSQLDAALAQMLVFHTRNHEQLLRLFRGSARYRPGEKYPSVERYERDYLLERTFGRALRAEIARDADLAHGEKLAKGLLTGAPELEMRLPEITFPQGLVGDVAQYIYSVAQRPVKEIALAGALTLCAGLAGRAFNINTMGLNIYTILIAETGRGKESAASGVDRLISHVSQTCPAIKDFQGPGHIASGQALIRALAKNPCQFAILSEFGHMLKIITDPRASASDMRTRQVLLDLFSKSGKGRVIQPSIYSDSDKNTPAILAPSFSFMGDTTPTTYNSAISEDMKNDGMLPRFLTITYDGPRVPPNKGLSSDMPPSPELVARLQSLVTSVANMTLSNHYRDVRVDAEAQAILDRFNDYCDDTINNPKTEEERELAPMWSRAYQKVLRIAGVVAVGRDHFEPIVTAEDARWAINLVVRDLEHFAHKVETGQMGTGNDVQARLLIQGTKQFFKTPHDKLKKAYKVHDNVLGKGCIPYNYYNERYKRNAAFAKPDPTKANLAIKATLQDLVDNGYLQKLSDAQVSLMLGGAPRISEYYTVGPSFPID